MRGYNPHAPGARPAFSPGWLGSLFTYHANPTDETIRHYGGHGNSFVKVIEFGPQPVARSVLVFGQSGDPDSPHYSDQTRIYASKGFKPAWFSREEVEAAAVRTYRPGAPNP